MAGTKGPEGPPPVKTHTQVFCVKFNSPACPDSGDRTQRISARTDRHNIPRKPEPDRSLCPATGSPGGAPALHIFRNTMRRLPTRSGLPPPDEPLPATGFPRRSVWRGAAADDTRRFPLSNSSRKYTQKVLASARKGPKSRRLNIRFGTKIMHRRFARSSN